MENESKIVELLSEMLHKFDVLTETVATLPGRVDNLTGSVDNLTSRVDNLTGRVDNLNVTVDLRLGKVESEIIKLNVISAENSRALLKMGDYNERIIRLERAVFKS
ncbi:MAG TPA: hypothetical protein VK589_07130 [Chryseolinea sp.]|nr:hypothetical protein [Chryseolinea sp.]